MDVFTCLDRLATRPTFELGNFPTPLLSAAGFDQWKFAAAAAVELSGMMDDCQNDDHLGEALDHFWSLLYGGVVSREEWLTAMLDVAEKARGRKTAHQNRVGQAIS